MSITVRYAPNLQIVKKVERIEAESGNRFSIIYRNVISNVLFIVVLIYLLHKQNYCVIRQCRMKGNCTHFFKLGK